MPSFAQLLLGPRPLGQVAAYSFIILVLIIVLHMVTHEPYLCWDDCLASIC